MISFSIADFSVFNPIICELSRCPSALELTKWRLISSMTRCSSLVRALLVSFAFIVSTDSSVSFSLLRICTSFLCVFSLSYKALIVSNYTANLPFIVAVFCWPSDAGPAWIRPVVRWCCRWLRVEGRRWPAAELGEEAAWGGVAAGF